MHNEYIFALVINGMYGIPHIGLIRHDALVQHLAPYGYHTSNNSPGIWTHGSRPINSILVVGIKYLEKEHTPHLKSVLEDK